MPYFRCNDTVILPRKLHPYLVTCYFFSIRVPSIVAAAPRDMQARPSYVVMRCLSVCVSATFVDSVKTNKHIIKKISLSGIQTVLVFFIPNSIAIFRREPP